MFEKAMAMLPVRTLRIAHTIILLIALVMASHATALWWSLDGSGGLQPGAHDSLGIVTLVSALVVFGGVLILILFVGRIDRHFQRYAQGGLEMARQDVEDLALIAQTVDAGVIVTDREGRIGWVNQSFTRITGYSLDEARGQSPGHLLHGPNTDQGTVARMRDCIQEGKPVRAEIINYAKDGREYWLDLNIQPVRDKYGNIIRYIAVNTEITLQKQLEKELSQTRNFLQAVIDHLPMALNVKDYREHGGGRYRLWNRKATEFTGLEAMTTIGRSDFDFWPRERAELLRASDLKAFAGSRLVENSSEAINSPALGRRWLHTRKVPIFDEKGRPHSLLSIAEDITENKRYQEELANEKALLRAIIDSIPDPVFFKDASGVYVGCNKAYAAIAGRSERELIGTTEYDTSGIKATDRRHIQEQQILADGKPHYSEEWVTSPDGRRILLETLETTYYDSDLHLLGLIGISRDITERKRVLEELSAAKEAAEKANSAKSVFLANMSHEIRTPLTSIIGFAEMLSDPTTEGAVRREAECTILRSGRHLLGIINDILDLSKIEAGQLGLECIPFSPLEICSNLDSEIGTLAREKGISFQMLVEHPMPTMVMGDPTRWKQILLNLCGNAVKFTAHGSVTLTVLYDRACARLQCGVADTGIGISAEQAKRLFQPFAQADNTVTRRYGGTGLGLRLVRHLAGAMGGDVTFKSEPGVGSEFVVRIDAPIAVGERFAATASERRAQKTHGVNSPSRRIGGRVLLAEDGLDNRKLICGFLGKLGLDVTTAENGEQAIEQALAGDFDVILMDIQMPMLDGVGATELLREAGYDRPIVALTANVMAEDVARYLRSGFTHWVDKPIDFAALSLLLCELLQPEALEKSPVIADDELPGYAEIKAEFEARFPDRIRQLNSRISEHDWNGARGVAHALAGTAGSFGYGEVSAAARDLEKAFVENESDRVSRACHALLDLPAVRDLCANKGKA